MKKILLALVILILILFILSVIPESKKVFQTPHFTFSFSRSIDTAKIRKLADALEKNYSRIAGDLKTIPAANIETNIYASRWRYIKATNNWGGSGNIEGIAKLHFVEQAWGEDNVEKVAVHEFTHTVTLKLLIDQEPQPVDGRNFDKKFATFPTWLWEAVSVYEAGQFVNPKTLPYLNQGQYPSMSELNQRMKGGKIYTCGYTIIEYIISKYGQKKLIELIKNYGHLQTTLGITEERFCYEWYDFVKTKYLR